jgi:molybdenum cofactor guanylyltransferase
VGGAAKPSITQREVDHPTVTLTSGSGVAGALLTGGASRRMGFDKTLVEVGGVPNAQRLAAVLRQVASPLVEVGPGRSGLSTVSEQPPGQGPLVAACAAQEALRAAGHFGAVLLLASDLPFMSAEVLAVIVNWPGGASVVPRVDGHAQPLCARWSAADLSAATLLAAEGERSMRALVRRPGVVFVDEEAWPGSVARHAFADVDTLDDLAGLGLIAPGPQGPGTLKR